MIAMNTAPGRRVSEDRRSRHRANRTNDLLLIGSHVCVRKKGWKISYEGGRARRDASMVEHETTSVLGNASPGVWAVTIGTAILALLILIDAAPLIYPEKIPISVKWPMRPLIERESLIAASLPRILLYAIWAAGAFAVFCMIDRLAISVSRILMLLLAFSVAIMAYEVFMRYVLVKPTLWVNEATKWIAGGIYLVSGLYVLQQRSHIRIYLLYDMVPRWTQRLFDLISTSLLCVFAAAVIYGGFNESWRKLLRWELYGTEWDPPMPATMKILILIIVVLLAMQSVSNLICDWSKPKKRHDMLDEVSEDVEAIKRSAGVSTAKDF